MDVESPNRRIMVSVALVCACIGLFWYSLLILSPIALTHADVVRGLSIFIDGIMSGLSSLPGISSAVATEQPATSAAALVVTHLRLPRVLCAMALGCCLGTAGVLMQGVTRNRLASPSLFGVTAGASLGLALYITGVFVTPGQGAYSGPGLATLMTLVGGGVAWALVVLLGGARNHSLDSSRGRLILAGVTVSALCGAMTRLTIILVEGRAQGVLSWLAGSLANVAMQDLNWLWPCTLIGVVLALCCAPRLNLINLGEETATTLGVNISRLRVQVFAISLLMVAASVVAVGPIGFVGLIAPNIARYVIGHDYRWLVPASAATGALIVATADLLGRAIAFPAETPAGIVTSLIGAPFFLYMARR